MEKELKKLMARLEVSIIASLIGICLFMLPTAYKIFNKSPTTISSIPKTVGFLGLCGAFSMFVFGIYMIITAKKIETLKEDGVKFIHGYDWVVYYLACPLTIILICLSIQLHIGVWWIW